MMSLVSTEVSPMSVAVRLRDAINSHDLDAFLACFHEDYQSEQPVHPGRGFGGRDQVRANWSTIFAGVPDLAAELRTRCEQEGRSGPSGAGPVPARTGSRWTWPG
jgi:hypothetical protein